MPGGEFCASLFKSSHLMQWFRFELAVGMKDITPVIMAMTFLLLLAGELEAKRQNRYLSPKAWAWLCVDILKGVTWKTGTTQQKVNNSMCRHLPKSRLTHLSFNVSRGYRLNAIQKQKHGLSSLYYDKKHHYQVSLSAFSSVNNSSDCKAKAYFSQTHPDPRETRFITPYTFCSE